MPDVYTAVAWAVALLAFVVGVQVLGVTMALVLLMLAVLVLTAVGFAAGRRVRRAHSRRDPRFRPTDEVFRDPGSGRLTRVHVDEATGERRYWLDE